MGCSIGSGRRSAAASTPCVLRSGDVSARPQREEQVCCDRHRQLTQPVRRSSTRRVLVDDLKPIASGRQRGSSKVTTCSGRLVMVRPQIFGGKWLQKSVSIANGTSAGAACLGSAASRRPNLLRSLAAGPRERPSGPARRRPAAAPGRRYAADSD